MHFNIQKQPLEVFVKTGLLQNYLTETPTQVFSCEICEIFKDTYFEDYLRTTTFKHSFS